MKFRLILLLIVAIDVAILLFEASRLSISSAEAFLLYEQGGFLQKLIEASLLLFGNNDFALRLPFLLFHVASIFLLYSLSGEYLKNERNRLWLVLIFVLLPGVVSAAVVASVAGFLIFALLLFLYIQRYFPPIVSYGVLFLYALLDTGFSYLFLGLFFYALSNKERTFALYNLGLYSLNIYLYGFVVHGYPRGHFLDTIGLYSAIFTPVIFIYIFYVLYRRYLTADKDIIWYIATTALLFSLFLSFRQKVQIEYFAPYIIMALPLAAQTFTSSYRVRLKEHRAAYRTIFIVAFIFLTLNTFVVFFNKELYLILDKPQKNFIYNMDIAKELAETLKNRNIECIHTDKKMQRRLRFYGIEKCDKYVLKCLALDSKEQANVTIRYKDVPLYRANVTKLNKD
jgi:hypothetical protein